MRDLYDEVSQGTLTSLPALVCASLLMFVWHVWSLFVFLRRCSACTFEEVFVFQDRLAFSRTCLYFWRIVDGVEVQFALWSRPGSSSVFCKQIVKTLGLWVSLRDSEYDSYVRMVTMMSLLLLRETNNWRVVTTTRWGLRLLPRECEYCYYIWMISISCSWLVGYCVYYCYEILTTTTLFRLLLFYPDH